MPSSSIPSGDLDVPVKETKNIYSQAKDSDELPVLWPRLASENITAQKTTEISDISRTPSGVSYSSFNGHDLRKGGQEIEDIQSVPRPLNEKLSSNVSVPVVPPFSHSPLAQHKPTGPQIAHPGEQKGQPIPALDTTKRENFLSTEEKDGPTPTLKIDGIDDVSINGLLRDILETLQDSSIAGPTAAKDDRSRFWGKYKRVAEEHDSEFLERYSSDMDIVLIFAGLFSAVSTSFIVAMESSLVPDPSDTTNALLLQIAQILGNSTTSGQVSINVPAFSGPSRTDVWVQTIAYLSLASSLLAAFGAVLGKQWLGYYKASRYGRGSINERSIRRQEKFEGLQTWYFDAVVQSFPILIQFSLLLFGLALSGHMWSEERTIAGVIIATTAFGILFYLLTLFASLLSPACPFQSPLSTICRNLVRREIYYKIYEAVWQLTSKCVMGSWSLISATLSTIRDCINQIFHRSSHLRPANNSKKAYFRWSNEDCEDATTILLLSLADVPFKGNEARSILWLLETSTDPEVLLAASRIIPEVEWHPDLDISAGFIQLSQMFLRSFDQGYQLLPGEYDKAINFGRAVNYFCWEMDEKKIQAINTLLNLDPNMLDDYIFWSNIGRSMQRLGNYDKFFAIVPKSVTETRPDSKVLPCNPIEYLVSRAHHTVRTFVSTAPKQDILQLLHLLPYLALKFARAEDYPRSPLQALVLGAISRVLNGQENLTSKSPGISDCAMVIGNLLGLQFDVKDKRKLDKSMAFDELVRAIYLKTIAILRDRLNPVANKLKKHIAIDCLPFIPPLLQLVSSRRSYYNTMTTDGHLTICKESFQLGATSELHLLLLQDSIRQTIDTLNPEYPDLDWGTTDISWRSSLWNPVGTRYRMVPGRRHHPWLLDYLRYLCATFPARHKSDYLDDSGFEPAQPILDLQGALLVSIYALDDLQDMGAEKIYSYLETITFCMGKDKPGELRCAALRAVYAMREIFEAPIIRWTAEGDIIGLKAFSEALHDDFYPPLEYGGRSIIVLCQTELRELVSQLEHRWMMNARMKERKGTTRSTSIRS